MKRIAALLFLAIVLLSDAPALAQVGYFGQNKVQYHSFKFEVLKSEHFDIYYYPEEAQAARMAARMAERWYARLSTILSHELRGRQPLVLYASGSHFRETNVVEGSLGEGTGGVTEAYKRRIVLPFAGPIEATDHVLGHELVHAFQYDITNTTASSAAAGNGGLMNLPLWFIEGMAEYLSVGPDDPHTAMWMRDAISREKFPEIDDLDNPRYFPYRYGQALWAYIGGRYGDRVVGSLLRAGVGRDGYKGAFARVLGVSSKDLSAGWQEATMAAFQPVAQMTTTARRFARPVVVNPKADGGGVNVSPELSPDGTKMVFFSSRDLFSIDLFVADAATGKIIRKITDTATNPHVESIGFLDSAGAWSHDGRRFVFPNISGGKPVLTIVNIENGDKERQIKLSEVAEILNPTWSPDGNQIAFSAIVGGLSDLYAYDLQASTLRRLTNDAFSELHPSWSPDGRRIAFSTDRFTSNLANLETGPTKLALLDVASGNVTSLGGFDGAKNINPQWTPDGRNLIFISDRQGVSNLYRIGADGGSPVQLTNLLTGVTGITAMSPAASVGGSRIVFSVYESDGYNIYALDNDAQTSGQPTLTAFKRDAGILPPRTTAEGTIASYLRTETAGLPSAATEAAYPTDGYKPRLSLDFIGQPMVGIGVDSFGTYVGGGISAAFSDILGNHTVGGSVQVTNRFDEAGGMLVYMNRARRWNWGAAVDSTPYVQRGYSQQLVVEGGETFLQEDEVRVLQTDRGLSGIAAYPFSRAQRLEFTGGLRQISGKQDITSRLYDLNTGQQLTEDVETISTFPTLNLGHVSSALVWDTSIFGVTSPIRGSRYRLQLDQTLGDLNYGSALADYRTYVMPVTPVTIAFRGMYYGRFGRDSEDPLLTPVFLGYGELLRGYDYNSFRAEECGVSLTGSCPVLDQLFGSRMVLGNVEVRMPLWSAFGGDNFYGPLPVEIGVFADAGAAWDRSGRLKLTGTDSNLVRSVGLLARINLLGFAVAEIDFVRPLDRPGRGWLWAFNLRPGF